MSIFTNSNRPVRLAWTVIAAGALFWLVVGLWLPVHCGGGLKPAS